MLTEASHGNTSMTRLQVKRLRTPPTMLTEASMKTSITRHLARELRKLTTMPMEVSHGNTSMTRLQVKRLRTPSTMRMGVLNRGMNTSMTRLRVMR